MYSTECSNQFKDQSKEVNFQSEFLRRFAFILLLLSIVMPQAVFAQETEVSIDVFVRFDRLYILGDEEEWLDAIEDAHELYEENFPGLEMNITEDENDAEFTIDIYDPLRFKRLSNCPTPDQSAGCTERRPLYICGGNRPQLYQDWRGYIRISSREDVRDDGKRSALIVHEELHAFGFNGHILIPGAITARYRDMGDTFAPREIEIVNELLPDWKFTVDPDYVPGCSDFADEPQD